jgi:hypothetical protein
LNAAAHVMGELARDLRRHLIRAHPLEIARQQREAAERQREQQAKADLAELAAIDEKWEKWLEEQRRMMMMEAEAQRHSHGVAAASVAVIAAAASADVTNAAEAVTAPRLPGWLREFFDSEPPDADNPLDLCNPYRDLILGTGDDPFFEADFSSDGPSLDLG